MDNFTQTYLIIGIALYLMTATFICVIGKDYIDEAIKKGEIENIDVNSPMLHLILMFLLIVIWPVTIIWILNSKQNGEK